MFLMRDKIRFCYDTHGLKKSLFKEFYLCKDENNCDIPYDPRFRNNLRKKHILSYIQSTNEKQRI